MKHDAIVYIVDDDPAVRDSISVLLQSANHTVKAYVSARKFLADTPFGSGCLITDVRMPDMDGLELQEQIVKRQIELPVIVITGHGDVPLAVRAMKAGAIDFIEKPFDDELLLDSVSRALQVGQHQRKRMSDAREAVELLSRLTPRERDVLGQLVAGHSNKVAAHELGISPRTIEIHRAHIMSKMNARSLSDLVRIALAAGDHGAAGNT